MENVEDVLNNSDYAFFFLIVDNSLGISLFPKLKNFYPIYAYASSETEYLKKRSLPYFCLEEQGIKLQQKNTGRLLASKQVINFIKQTCIQPKKTACIIPFKPSAKLQILCQKYHWHLVANDAKINRQLEDKIKFYQSCFKQGISLIPADINIINHENFSKAQQKYGQNIIIQTHFGWAGNSTFCFSDYSQIPGVLYGVKAKFSPLIQGYSLLNNCCVYQNNLLQSPPALQYTGLFPYTHNPFSTVGRQWPSTAPKQVIDQVHQITTQFFQKILLPLHYRGFFGLDFLVGQDNQVYLLECNPRLTASFAFYTSIEQKNGLIPLFYFHLAEFINSKLEIDIQKQQERFDNPSIIGSEITSRNASGQIIYKHHDFIQFSQSHNPIKIDPKVTAFIKSKINEI